jgi:hypothetical protein
MLWNKMAYQTAMSHPRRPQSSLLTLQFASNTEYSRFFKFMNLHVRDFDLLSSPVLIQIGMRPRASQVCFAHCPAIALITVSSAKFCLSSSEADCVCAWQDVTLLQLFVYFMVVKSVCVSNKLSCCLFFWDYCVFLLLILIISWNKIHILHENVFWSVSWT